MQESNRQDQEQQLLVMGSKLQLPQGGGALTGLEENLSVSQATGMLNMTVKLPFLENRHAFNQPIALHYSSANGNGILGMGWDLGLPAIFRKTDQRIPEYRDADESDTFVLTGQDDLVPCQKKDADGQWVEDTTSSQGLTVRRYRPRVEKDFFKIERVQSGIQTSWKVTSGTNTVTFYGLTEEGRIADPKDSRRIWKWLPQLSVDNLGNTMRFRYKKEQPDWPGQANRYLKQIQYGNAVPYYLDETHRYTPDLADDERYFFDIVLDYGDQDDADPGQSNPSGWPLRADSFTTFRPGFELRTERIVKRIVFFNRFKALSGDGPVIPVPVKSMDLTYRTFGCCHPATPCEADYLTAITESSWRRHPDGRLERRSLPGLTLAYANPEDTPSRSGVIQLDETSLVGGYLLCDYENEGVPGILTEKPEGLYYSANLGGGAFGQPEKVLAIPSVRGLGGRPLEIGVLDPGGRKFLISMNDGVPGFFEQDSDGLTLGFTPFKEVPRADPGLANRCYLDLNGDGLGELALFGDGKVVFYPNHGRLGFGAALTARLPDGEAQLIWSDRQTGLYLADMNGDGLTDIVQVSHRAVSYWPNSGYGLFGDRVQMAHAPTLAAADAFRPDRVLLADLTGTGAADLVYAGGQELVVFLNACGNAFRDGIATGLALDRAALGRLQAADLFSSGLNVLACRCQTASGQDGFCYFDLLSGVKPYLLTAVTNPCGRQSTVAYQCATASYLADKRDGVPWVLRLPFAVFCVAATTTRDMTTGLTMTRSYRYRHGSYDGCRREFNGFGLVELTENESLAWAETPNDPPAAPRLTRTWHHIGTADEWPAVLARYEQEYFRDSSGCAPCGDPAELPVGLACGQRDVNDAWRALKFALVRQEIYGPDGTGQAAVPYQVTAAGRTVRIVQPAGRLAGLCALALETDHMQLVYERDAAHPRVSRVVNIRFDEQSGMVLEQAVISCGRPPEDELPDPVIQAQNKIQIRYTVYRYTQWVDDAHYRLPQLAEQTSYELHDPAAGGQEDAAALETLFASAPPVAFLAAPDDRLAFKRKLGADRILYYGDDLQEPLPLGVQAARGAVNRRYSQVFDREAAGMAYRGEIGAAQLAAAGYASTASLISEGLFDGPDDGGWWTATEQLVYGPEPLAEFCLPRASRDFSGKDKQITYFGDDFLIMSALTDAMGFKTELTDFDMRLLRPTRLVDRNLNSTELVFDIFGFVAARALRGKGDEADRLPAGPPDLSETEVAAFFLDPSDRAAAVLGSATERFVTSYAALPVRVARIARETHQAMLPPGRDRANQPVQRRQDRRRHPLDRVLPPGRRTSHFGRQLAGQPGQRPL